MRSCRWFLLATALTVAAGCSDSSGASITAALDGPVMRYSDPAPSDDGAGAEVRGTLELVGDCLYNELAETGERSPIVWPAGTAWNAETARVILPSGVRVPVGSSVHGGGSYRNVADVGKVLGSEAEVLAERCVDNPSGEVAFVNNDDDAIEPVN